MADSMIMEELSEDGQPKDQPATTGTLTIGFELVEYARKLQLGRRYFSLSKKQRKAWQRIVRSMEREALRLDMDVETWALLQQDMLEAWVNRLEKK